MAQLIDVSRSYLLTFLDGRKRIAAYGKTRDEIEQSVVKVAQEINKAAGFTVTVPNARRARVMEWSGHILWWLGVVLLIPSLSATYVLWSPENPPPTLITGFSGIGLLLMIIGYQLQSRGQRMLTLDAVTLPDAITRPEGVVSEPNSRIWRAVDATSTVLLLVGLILIAGVILIDFLGFKVTGAVGFGVFGIFGGGIVLIIIGSALGNLVKRHLQPSASDLCATDNRKRIIFLRSFRDDKLKIITGWVGQGTVTYERFETALSNQFAPFGPLIAIGKPGERLPEFGGARDYPPDATWKEVVSNWMKEARLIIVIAGLSEGLRWELETVADFGFLSKLLVIVPLNKRRWRWRFLVEVLSSLPRCAGLPEKMPKNLRVLHFGADGEPFLICVRGNWEEDYERAVRFAVYGILRGEQQPPRAAVA